MAADRIVSAADAPRTGWLRLAVGAAALMAFVPFLLPVHHFPVQSFYQEWLAFALGSIGFVALGVASPERRIEAPRVVVLPLGLCVLLAIQIAAGKLPFWQQGVLGALYLLWAAAIAALGYGLRRRLGWTGFAALISCVLTAGALATALLALAQLSGWGGQAWIMPLATTRVYGNLGQPNHFADYVSLGLISVVYLAVAGRLAKLPAGAIAVFFLSVLSFSGSRAVWIYLLAAVALAVWLRIRTPGPQSRAMLRWTVGLAAAMIVLQPAVYFLSADWGQISETVGARMIQESTGVATRLRHAQATWLMLQSAPLLGVGFEAYAWHHFLLAPQLPPHPDLGVVDHAHNIVLQLVSEFGLLGAALGLAAGWRWVVAQRAARWDIERWWVCALLATLLAHSLLEYPLWYAYFLGVFALLLGAADEISWRFASSALDRIAFAAAALLAAWTLGSIAFDYRRLENLAQPRPELQVQLAQVRAAMLELHRASLFAHLVEFALARSIQLDPEGLADKIAVNGRAMHYLPTADMVFRHSALLALAGNLRESFALWDLAVAAYPAEVVAVAAQLREIARRDQPGLSPLVEYAASR